MWIALLFIFISSLQAAPNHLEVWFLSHAKRAEILQSIQKKDIDFSKAIALLQCQEMGEYCFDPQYGLYKKGEEGAIVNAEEAIKNEDKMLPHAESVDRNLIECDSTNRFDIFCGKSRKVSIKKPSIELWVDTSSSMKEVDFMAKDGSCSRARLVKKIDAICPFQQSMGVMMFDTSIKEAGEIDSLCLNQGLNDYKKLMDWIERSEAKKLIVITDIYELHKEFSDFIEAKGGKLRGDKDLLTSEQMVNLADELAKMCK
jgi:hypothetical protein